MARQQRQVRSQVVVKRVPRKARSNVRKRKRVKAQYLLHGDSMSLYCRRQFQLGKRVKWHHYTHAIPSWLTKADLVKIRKVYAEARRRTRATGVKHQVDHVIPLRNPNVCGLHVLSNLKITTKAANAAKGNRWDKSI